MTESILDLPPGEDARQAAARIRRAIRSGAFRSHTSGLAPDRVQCNVVIVPAADASDFLRYCQRNPKPCPLVYVSEPGERLMHGVGRDIDICSDVPRYRVFREGKPCGEADDVAALWRDDLQSFLLGCSFSFEHALCEAGIKLRHLELGKNVAMYKTSVPTEPAGKFSGPLVVSMRPMRAADAIRAIQICSRFPNVHGAPVHLGDPSQIGIEDLQRPDFGDPVPLLSDELPVFWACGVTPQLALERATPELCITHAPGCMLITDLANQQLASF